MSAQNVKYGVYGGLAGGAVFGVMMAMMGMLPMIGQMVGSSSSIVGFVIHMVNSAIIGAAFAVVFGGVVAGIGSGVGYGLGYGVIWWLLGPLTLMPLFMGMGFGVNWNLAAATDMGHRRSAGSTQGGGESIQWGDSGLPHPRCSSSGGTQRSSPKNTWTADHRTRCARGVSGPGRVTSRRMMSTGPSVRTFLRFLTGRRTLLISAPFSRGVMSVSLNVITPQGLEPLQFPTKFRSPSTSSLKRPIRCPCGKGSTAASWASIQPLRSVCSGSSTEAAAARSERR